MSFTTIQNTTSWQDLQIAKEIRVAYNKRRTACGLSTYADPTNAVKVKDFVYAIQTGIEEMLTLWGDYDTTLSGQSSLPWNYATAAAAMTKAGLTIAGYWRRIPVDGHAPVHAFYDSWPSAYEESGWSYGKLQSGDQAGPWLFQDIEHVLSSLRRRYFESPGSGTPYAQYTCGDGSGTRPGGMTWTFPGDTVSGNVDTTAINETTGYVLAAFTVSKTNVSGAPTDFINSAIASCDLARFRMPCGLAVTGTTRTVKFIGMLTGSDPMTALTGVSALDTTVVTTESPGTATEFLKWWPQSPSSIGTKSWQSILDMIVDATVTDGSTVELDCSVQYNEVLAVSDYAFVDGATS